VRGGGPDAVIEIRSPEDDTYDKLPFYASLGVREMVVCDRDTKEPEIFRLAGSQYVVLQRDAEGWLRSDVLGVGFRRIDGTPPHLRVADTAAHADVEI
jgi:Uma2 family endonuclease